MATKFETFNKATAQRIAVEKWSTRFGASTRVVKRTNGQFVTNVSAKQMIKA